MLRASLLDWPDANPAPHEVAALREVLALLRRIPDKSSAGDAEALLDALARLGLGAINGFCARLMAQAIEDECAMSLRPRRIDALTERDDPAVIAALWADKTFSRAPALLERRVETGVVVRQGVTQGALAARLAARETEMNDTAKAIASLLEGGPAPETPVVRGAGFSAVDSARGRLHHACRLNGDGRIADYRIVAPTEWNFHPDGPFARLLIGARIGEGLEAKRRIERLAFAFDPCIKAEAEFLGATHA
jgi:hypothetical protein